MPCYVIEQGRPAGASGLPFSSGGGGLLPAGAPPASAWRCVLRSSFCLQEAAADTAADTAAIFDCRISEVLIKAGQIWHPC